MARPALSLLTELGSTGLTEFSGFVQEEWLPELSGTRKLKVYREMRDNDPVIGAILFAVSMLIRQAEWRVEPAFRDRESADAASFVEGCLLDMETPFSDVIDEILSMLVFGFSFHEIVYKKRLGRASRHQDGLIGWQGFPIRAQETLDRWEFSDSGEVTAFLQSAPPRYQPARIPMEKGLLFRTSTHKGNPEGRSILRSAYKPWYFKKHIEIIEGIGIERDLAGLPIAWVPPEILSEDASASEKLILSQIKRIITNIRRDEQEGIVFPLAYDESGNKLYDLALLASGGKREFDTSEIIERYDRRIAQTCLADFILLGHEKVGSFALASSKTDIFAMAIGAWLDSIAGVFNRYAIPRLFEINGIELEGYPRLVPSDIETPELSEVADYIAALASAGAALFPDIELENHLRRIGGLPERKEAAV